MVRQPRLWIRGRLVAFAAMDVEHAGALWGVTVQHPLEGGSRSAVWLTTSSTGPAVLRRSTRPVESLAWELDLLEHLVARGVPVPRLIRAQRGQRHVDGWHLLDYVEGNRLTSDHDPRLTAVLVQLHHHTMDWPQRPHTRSAHDLTTQPRGGDIDLERMPAYLAAEIRRAWAALPISGRCVVHGDPGARNTILTESGDVVLIDWDEARVDDPAFDVGTTPTALHAQLAWEVATCWHTEPAYARHLSTKLLKNR